MPGPVVLKEWETKRALNPRPKSESSGRRAKCRWVLPVIFGKCWVHRCFYFVEHKGFHPQLLLSINHKYHSALRIWLLIKQQSDEMKKMQNHTFALRCDTVGFSQKRCGRNVKIADFFHVSHSADRFLSYRNRRTRGELAHDLVSSSYTSLCCLINGQILNTEGYYVINAQKGLWIKTRLQSKNTHIPIIYHYIYPAACSSIIHCSSSDFYMLLPKSRPSPTLSREASRCPTAIFGQPSPSSQNRQKYDDKEMTKENHLK